MTDLSNKLLQVAVSVRVTMSQIYFIKVVSKGYFEAQAIVEATSLLFIWVLIVGDVLAPCPMPTISDSLSFFS